MLSVIALAAESGNHTSVLSLRSLVTRLTETTTSLRLAFATNTFEKAYAKRGGFSSALGMPIAAAYEARDKVIATTNGNGYMAQFRSGALMLANGVDGTATSTDTDEAQIMLVGIECRAKQEKTDEIIGSVGYIRPSDANKSNNSGVTPIEKLDMGPKGERIINLTRLVYQGPFANVILSCSLIEKDSGDTTKYREAFAKEIQKAAAVGAGAAGVPAETLAGGEDWMRQLSLGLSNVIFDLLGADDDQFNLQSFQITAKEMQARKDGELPDKTLTRDDDPHSLNYTHRMIVSGTDDGGDYGEYAFYFSIATRLAPPLPEFE